jgi:hypothetical protein
MPGWDSGSGADGAAPSVGAGGVGAGVGTPPVIGDKSGAGLPLRMDESTIGDEDEAMFFLLVRNLI